MGMDDRRRAYYTTIFELAAALEPELLNLLREAKRHHRGLKPGFCANRFWYGRFEDPPSLKSRMCKLVGGGCRLGKDHPVMASSPVYDAVYHTLYEALPDCQHPEHTLCTG